MEEDREDKGKVMAITYKTPLSMFRQGIDTYDIALQLGCHEATVYNIIHSARNAERPQKPKIAYAGKE